MISECTAQQLADEARKHHAEGNLPQAIELWQLYQERTPANPTGTIEAALIHQQQSDFSKADEILTAALIRFPASERLSVEYARVPHRQADWPQALLRWRNTMRRFPESGDAVAGVGTALQVLGQLDEADMLLTNGIAGFPKNAAIAVEYARVAVRRRDWPDARRRWQIVLDRFPANFDAVLGLSIALKELKNYSELDILLGPAVERFPDHAGLAADFARTALYLGDVRACAQRWQTAYARFPDDQTIAEGVGEGRFHLDMAALDLSTGPTGEPPPSKIDDGLERRLSNDELMMAFESLGSGCGFGLVQRHFGAEPLGLLRWGAIPCLSLIDAVNAQFAGVGDEAQVELFEFGRSGEYFFRDRKYNFEMHTFIRVDPAIYERILKQQIRRVRYLARKLVDDIKNTDDFKKIFIYKRHAGILPETEANLLIQAIRKYGNHNLLCVFPESEDRPNGTVFIKEPGLLYGYLDELSLISNEKGIRYNSWLNVCRAAHELVAAQTRKQAVLS